MLGKAGFFDRLENLAVIILYTLAPAKVDDEHPVTADPTHELASEPGQLQKTRIPLQEVVIYRELEGERLAESFEP
jgi:hypothetical protein